MKPGAGGETFERAALLALALLIGRLTEVLKEHRERTPVPLAVALTPVLQGMQAVIKLATSHYQQANWARLAEICAAARGGDVLQ